MSAHLTQVRGHPLAVAAGRSQPPMAQPATEPFRVYRVPILMYHRIVAISQTKTSRPDLVVPPATFSSQLRALSGAGWHTITMAKLATYMEANEAVPAKAFVITIDDGWADGYENALPIMREYGFVATFFVIAGRIDTKGALSSQELRTLQAYGNEIGNHTEDHVNLTTVSPSRVKQEVETASERIAEVVGHRPVSMAYPNGGVGTSVVGVVCQIPDIKVAVTIERGATETWTGRYRMPRVPVHPDTAPAGLLASFDS